MEPVMERFGRTMHDLYTNMRTCRSYRTTSKLTTSREDLEEELAFARVLTRWLHRGMPGITFRNGFWGELLDFADGQHATAFFQRVAHAHGADVELIRMEFFMEVAHSCQGLQGHTVRRAGFWANLLLGGQQQQQQQHALVAVRNQGVARLNWQSSTGKIVVFSVTPHL